jgi:transcriptional regulator of acetoin/glycerol metabolism
VDKRDIARFVATFGSGSPLLLSWIVNLDHEPTLAELERVAIAHALRKKGMSIKSAAHQLGIGRATIYRKLRGYIGG